MKYLVCGLALWFMSTASFAVSPELVKQRALMEALAYRTMATMSLCSLQDSQAAQRRLDTILKLGDEYSQQLAQEWPAITRQWRQTEQFIVENRSSETLQQAAFAARLQEHMEQLFAAFEQDRPSLVSLPPAQNAELELLLGLDKMLSGYIFFNANIFGGHASGDTHIESEYKKFEQNLGQLKNENLRDDLGRKWHFIKDTLLAYNERSAVFVIDRTGLSMQSLLLAEFE